MKKVGIYVAIALGVYIFNSYSSADRDDDGAIVGEGQVNAFQMRVGDCFDDTDTSSTAEEIEVTNVPGVPCSQAHDNEVFAILDVNAASYPEGDGMSDLAFDSCLERFESFVGRDYESSSLDIFAMYPTRNSWNQHSDREVVCAVYDMKLNKLEGSVKGMAL